jgi:hypothetical protein
MTCLIEARTGIYEALAGRTLASVEFVLCEDDRTVMIYADSICEEDATARCFDLEPGETFNPMRYRAQFFKPLVVQ